MIQLTPDELALDLPDMLRDTEQAIILLREADVAIPDEAHQIAAILRRAIAAEERLKEVTG